MAFQRILPETPAEASLLIYFLLPVIVVCLSYGSALILCRYAPAVWKLLSGGRKLDGGGR